VRSSSLNGTRLHTPYGMVGYCWKDHLLPHFRCLKSPLIDDDMIKKGRCEYLIYGNIIDKGCTALTIFPATRGGGPRDGTA